MSGKQDQRAYIGFWSLTSIIINNIIGSGIFSAPSSIIQSSNSIGLSLAIWLVTGLIATTGAFVYAELASTLTFSGGDTNYLNFIRWKGTAFMFTLSMVIMVYPTILCIQALTFSDYFLQACNFNPTSILTAKWANFAVSFLIIFLIVVLNFGMDSTYFRRFILILTTTKIVFLLVVVVLACVKGNLSNLSRPFENSTLNPDLIVDSFYKSWFAFDGYDISAVAVEEIIEPQVLLPKAVSCSMLVVIALYMLINFAYALVLGTKQMIHAENIVAKFSEVLLGKQSFLIPILVSLSLFGAMYGTVFEAARITHAMARDGVLPRFLGCYNTTKNIPRTGIILQFIISVIFLFVLSLNQLNDLNMYEYISQWLQRAISATILLYIRVNRVQVGDNVFRLNILFPCLYLVCLISMTLSTVVADWKTIIFTIAAGVGAYTIYFTFKWPKGLRRWTVASRFITNLDEKATKVAETLFRSKVEEARFK